MPTHTINLKAWSCKCGTVYAVPEWVDGCDITCPMCARRQIRDAKNRAYEESENAGHMERQIISLRGVITRLKRANKGRS